MEKFYALTYDSVDPSDCGLAYRADASHAVSVSGADVMLDEVRKGMNEDFSEWEKQNVIGFWVVSKEELDILEFVSSSYSWFSGSEDQIDEGLHTLTLALAKWFHERRTH